MLWFIFAPLQLVCTVICYLTNWLVIFFANENGELPGLLRLWQTWDDTLDNKTDIERMPSFLQYDWDVHYLQGKVTEEGQIRYVEQLVKPFTMLERFKRYFCRCHWLYRNCAYGFAYYWFGKDVFPPISAPLWLDKPENGYFLYGNKFTWKLDNDCTYCGRNPWAFKCTAPFSKNWRWEIYLGWKIQRSLDNEHRAMIANRIWFSRL